MAGHRIAVLMTSHNRKDKTLACLATLRRQQLPLTVSLHPVLVDAGSSDGTQAGVAHGFPEVQLIKTDTNVFWSQGTHIAFKAAMDAGFDFYLWLNDDTLLDDDALGKLLDTLENDVVAAAAPSIVVGCTRDPESGQPTYGGVVRSSRLHPLKFRLAPPSSVPQCVDTMNGNCVLIPAAVAERVGNLDPAFAHSMGDFDYGLMARKAGCSIWTVPGTVGTCARNSTAGSWHDVSLPLHERWRKKSSPKGLPPAEWKTFARRHAGIGWPLYWSLPYIRLLLSAIRRQRR